MLIAPLRLELETALKKMEAKGRTSLDFCTQAQGGLTSRAQQLRR